MRNLVIIFVFVATLPLSAKASEFSLNGHTFHLPDGFTIELVADSPLVDRPISAAFDEQGRLYVTDSSGSNEPLQQQLIDRTHRIVRLEDTDADGRFDSSIVFADRMMFPEGAMWLDGSLYVAAPPSIWKLTDTDGDGVADQRVEWFQGKTLTNCGNDLHGPYLGKDGWIYWCKGAFAPQTYERPDGQPFVTKAAHIFRCRADAPLDPQTGGVLSSAVEHVMTGGMDNPVEIAFSKGGERFFTTTFLVNPAGGQRDGIIHAIYGGVYGKQQSAIDGYARTGDLMPVLSHLGAAAPSGLTTYQSGVFGESYRGNLLATLFNMHKVTRHVLKPDGATFRTEDSDLVVSDNVDFHPTDVLEDADGSLLVVDTGGWYKLCCPTSQLSKPDVLGAIYRIRRADAPVIADPRGLKMNWAEMLPTELVRLLADERIAVAQRAIHVLGKRGASAIPVLQSALTESEQIDMRINAVWALARIDDPSARAATRAALKDTDDTVRQAAIHSISVWRDAEAVGGLSEILRQASAQNMRVAAEAIGRIGDKSAAPALLEAADAENDRVLQHSLTYALIELSDTSSLQDALTTSDSAAKSMTLIALDQLPAGNLQPDSVVALLTSSDPLLTETAGWIVDHHVEWGPHLLEYFSAQFDNGQLLPTEKTHLKERLAKFSADRAVREFMADRLDRQDTADETKALILAAMGESKLSDPPAVWVASMTSLLQSSDLRIKQETISALRRLSTNNVQSDGLVASLMHIARDDANPTELRVNAMAIVPGGLAEVAADDFELLIRQLNPEVAVSLRAAAVEALGQAEISVDQQIELSEGLKTASPLDIDNLLKVFERTNDERVGQAVVDALMQSPARRALRVATLKPRLEHFPESVQQSATRLYERMGQDNANQQQRLEQLQTALPEGDARRGQLVFHSTKASCSACHTIGYLGGSTGPDLTNIGRIRTQGDLLEAVVFPSASLVRSFESVSVLTLDGKVITGMVRIDNEQELILATGPNQEARIPKEDVEEINESGDSIMPAGLDTQLAPQELADLLEFLNVAR